MRYHTEDHMPMFMCLLNWTEQGIRSIKEAQSEYLKMISELP